MQRIGLALVAALALVGCAAAQPVDPTPRPTGSVTAAEVPDGGVLLSSLGYQHAPASFSVPQGVEVTDRIDAHNNVTAVFAPSSGAEVLEYLGTHLDAMGFEVTADGNDSLLFTDGHWQGAFTASGAHAALSLRTDREASG